MTTSQQISRFITNLDGDDFMGFEVFDKLCDHYNWQGAVFGDLDIGHIFKDKTGRDITETELETIRENVNLYDLLCGVAMRHITDVVSAYLYQQEDENE